MELLIHSQLQRLHRCSLAWISNIIPHFTGHRIIFHTFETGDSPQTQGNSACAMIILPPPGCPCDLVSRNSVICDIYRPVVSKLITIVAQQLLYLVICEVRGRPKFHPCNATRVLCSMSCNFAFYREFIKPFFIIQTTIIAFNLIKMLCEAWCS